MKLIVGCSFSMIDLVGMLSDFQSLLMLPILHPQLPLKYYMPHILLKKQPLAKEFLF